MSDKTAPVRSREDNRWNEDGSITTTTTDDYVGGRQIVKTVTTHESQGPLHGERIPESRETTIIEFSPGGSSGKILFREKVEKEIDLDNRTVSGHAERTYLEDGGREVEERQSWVGDRDGNLTVTTSRISPTGESTVITETIDASGRGRRNTVKPNGEVVPEDIDLGPEERDPSAFWGTNDDTIAGTEGDGPTKDDNDGPNDDGPTKDDNDGPTDDGPTTVVIGEDGPGGEGPGPAGPSGESGGNFGPNIPDPAENLPK
ncbi:hypothetical protein [Streptomyces sp. TM32]|uniref:hypothetical protein n=1 Tax=Streptomyces sp. TM32 TaxID=1652669 RepID=UPI0012ABAE38|nr:hypothetical protein [Streptomyces sp. TM32]